MTQAKRKPGAGKPGRPRVNPVEAQLNESIQGLTDLQDQDGSTGQYSLDHCALMAKFWGARMLEANARYTKTKDMRDFATMRQASVEAGEWEKRKAGAMASTKVDLLRQVLAALDAQAELSGELEEIEE